MDPTQLVLSTDPDDDLEEARAAEFAEIGNDALRRRVYPKYCAYVAEVYTYPRS